MGKIKGRKINLLKHVFASYSLPIIFSQIFSLATLARLHFILHLEMQASNVLYQPHLYSFLFLVSLSLTDSFQNSLKTRIKLHKIAYKMSKNCLRGWGGGCGGKGGRLKNWGKSAMVVGGIDAPGQYSRRLMLLQRINNATNALIARVKYSLRS